MLTLWNPFNDLFDDYLWPRFEPTRQEYRPAVDVTEDENSYIVSADVPGLTPEDVNVTVEQNLLTVSGERSLEKKSEHQGYRRIERRYGSFKRSFTLPEGVDVERIEALVEHGTLTVRIPKPAVIQPKKIKVIAGSLKDKAKGLFSKASKEGQAEATAP